MEKWPTRRAGEGRGTIERGNGDLRGDFEEGSDGNGSGEAE